MLKARLPIAKSLRRILTNQYLGIFTVIYFLLLIFTMLTRAGTEYINTREHLTESIYQKISLEEEIINQSEEYRDSIEKYILSYAEYQKAGKEMVMTEGEGAMPAYDYLSSFRLFDIIRYFVRTGDALFVLTDYDVIHSEMYVKFNLFDFSKDNLFFQEMLVFLLSFGAIYLFGVLLFVSIGNAKAKKALQPIHDLTTLASSINESNLNLRIDVESARYELKELCITLNSMLDRIEKVYMKQKAFVSDVSHELRTPISVIDGYVNMLKRWGSSDSVVLDESIEAILSETKSMKELVEALLFLARYDNQTIRYEMTEVDISGLLEEVFHETKLLDKEVHQITASIQSHLVCIGDYSRIKECLRIFIDNCLKFTAPGKAIHIAGEETERHIIITLSDQGIGISKQHLGNIFNRFYRVDSSRAKETGGSGLGLSIARAIILAHEGKVKITSKEGEGTTLKVFFSKYRTEDR